MSTSHYANAHDFHVERPTYITATNYNHGAIDATPFDLLFNNIAEEAMHNSSERCDAPKVHPETRKAVQEEIFTWITDQDRDSEPKKILWVSGPAGAGKTAIAGSIAELCDEEGLLAGSFFFSSFSGSKKRCSKQYVVATLAYCLLQHDGSQALRSSILSMIQRDPTIFRKTLRDQCKFFLLRPFYEALGSLDLSALPKVIILDGLDEVEANGSRQLDKYESRSANEADQVEILAMLLRAALDPKFPFRIIIFSRPERVISNFFGIAAEHISRKIFLDDKYDPDSDIELFLRAKFAAIRRRYSIREGWPSSDDIGLLVANASGQFIYAATVVRFLECGRRPNPQTLLRSILEPTSPQQTLDALVHLDSLYTRILMSSPDPPLALRWICAGHIDSFHTHQPTAKFIRQLFQDFEGQEGYLLENLASLVRIPSEASTKRSPYQFYHKSMLDFLRSPQRCGQLLNDSYNASTDFLCGRWYSVLRTRSTVVPLMSSEWGNFLFEFWEIYYDIRRETMFGRLCDFPSCDIAKWVRLIDAVCRHHHKAYYVGHIFRSIHLLECCSLRLTDCSDACRHWRSAILGECKRLGWDTPPHAVLLLERMNDEYVKTSPRWLYELIQRQFQAPRSCPLPLASPRSKAESQIAHKQADTEQYEALLTNLQIIYDALPADWECCFNEIIQGGGSDEDALTAQLRRVRPEVRLQMEGLDAWLNSESDSEKSEESDSEETDEKENSSCSEGEGSERDQDWYHSQLEGASNLRTEPHLPQHETAEISSGAVEATPITFDGEEPDPQEEDIAGGDSTSSLDIRVFPIHDPFPGPHLSSHPFAFPRLSESRYNPIPQNGHAAHSTYSGVRMTLAASFPKLPPLEQHPRFPAFSLTSPRRSLGLESTSGRVEGERVSQTGIGNESRCEPIPRNGHATHPTYPSVRMTLETSFPRLPPLDSFLPSPQGQTGAAPSDGGAGCMSEGWLQEKSDSKGADEGRFEL